MLLPAALLEGTRTSAPPISTTSWLRIVYLGAIALSGVILLGETITPLAVVGGLLVLIGVWISSRGPAASST